MEIEKTKTEREREGERVIKFCVRGKKREEKKDRNVRGRKI